MFTKLCMETSLTLNDNVNFTKLCMHGYKFINAILTEMKTEEKDLTRVPIVEI